MAAQMNNRTPVLTLLGREKVRHESPEDGSRKEIEYADPHEETSIDPRLLAGRHELHENEKNNQVRGEEAIGDRNESAPRHPRDDGGEQRIRYDHCHKH